MKTWLDSYNYNPEGDDTLIMGDELISHYKLEIEEYNKIFCEELSIKYPKIDSSCNEKLLEGFGKLNEYNNAMFFIGLDETIYTKKQKEKRQEYQKEYTKKQHVKKSIRISQWKKLGMNTPKEGWNNVFRILEEQNYCCKICGIHESDLKKSLSLDHCHKSGDVRGFLCNSCNVGLGNFKDNINSLCSAISYLNKQGEKE